LILRSKPWGPAGQLHTKITWHQEAKERKLYGTGAHKNPSVAYWDFLHRTKASKNHVTSAKTLLG